MLEHAFNLVSYLSAFLNLSNINIDEQYRCTLNIDAVFLVTLQYVPIEESFWLYSILGPLPDDHEIQKIVLNNNVLDCEGCLGAYEEGKGAQTLVYKCEKPLAALTPESFVVCLENFINTAEKWKTALNDIICEKEDISALAKTRANCIQA